MSSRFGIFNRIGVLVEGGFFYRESAESAAQDYIKNGWDVYVDEQRGSKPKHEPPQPQPREVK